MRISLQFIFFLLLHSVSNAQNGSIVYTSPFGFGSSISEITISTNGTKYSSSFNNGIAAFKDGNWTNYNKTNSNIPSNSIYSISADNQNRVWMGSKFGLTCFDGTTWTTYNRSNSGINCDSVYRVKVRGNDVWVTSHFGVSHFNGTQWTNFKMYENYTNAPKDYIYSLAIDQAGVCWGGTNDSGLIKFNGTSLERINRSNSSFKNSKVLAVYFDNQNNLWVSSDSNIYVYNTNIDFIPVKTLFPKLLAPSCISKTIYNGPRGGVAFESYNGITEIINNEVYNYYLNYTLYARDRTSDNNGLLWYITAYNKLVSFDYTKYIGLGLGLTSQNSNVLDVNQAAAPINNIGVIGYSTGLQWSGYLVPKGRGISPLSDASIWIGGLDGNNDLHLAANRYPAQTGYDFFPGPLDTINGIADSSSAIQFDKIWKLDKWKIEEFKYNYSIGNVQNGSYVIDNQILTWPAHGTGGYTRNMAPFVDVNNDGLYSPFSDGDYPAIKGDQMLFSVFNDNLGIHDGSGGIPLRVEVHFSAYSFSCPEINDSTKVIEYTTFYNYKIFNRSNINYTNTKVGVYMDTDFGNYSDDYLGCDSALSFGYTYNADDYDEGSAGYGINPPIFGCTILNGPKAIANDGIDNNNNELTDEVNEKCLMTNYIYFNNDYTKTGNPEEASDFYGYLGSEYKDSSCIEYKGCLINGTSTSNCRKFMYSDWPNDPAGWNEANCGNNPADRRSVLGTGPFNFNAGSSFEYDFALVFSGDSTLMHNTVEYYQHAFNDVNLVRNWYTSNSFPSCLSYAAAIEDNKIKVVDYSIYPNPTNSILNIAFKGAKSGQIEITDVNGRIVIQKQIQNVQNLAFDLNEVANGVYAVSLNNNYLNKIVVYR